MNINELPKRNRFDPEAVAFVREQAEAVLGEASATMGTGALVEAIWFSKPPKEIYALIVALLATVRYTEGTQDKLWRYTGRKNMYGKPAIEWLPQKPSINT